MPLHDQVLPEPMSRVAIVAPSSRWRKVLVEVAGAGVFEADRSPSQVPGPLRTRAERLPIDGTVTPELAVDEPSPAELESDPALLLGEASIEERSAASRHVGRSQVLPGWVRRSDLDPTRGAIAPLGGALVELPGRPGLEAPTAHGTRGAGAAFRPLVSTYATVPSRDLDPTLFAAFAYMVMFGMMFGDVAHGAAIVLLGVMALRRDDGAFRAAAPFLIGAGAAASVFGLLYGEAFGPTGLVPTLWIRPLDEPETLLVAGLLVGGVLLSITYALAIVNRWREGGARLAVYDPAGIAGGLLLAGLGAVAAGVVSSRPGWTFTGAAILALGGLLVLVGLRAHAGTGASGWAQALVELFDTLIRLGSNVVSFTRLAAFGLTHAVIGQVVWDGTVSLWNRGSAIAAVAAAALFVVGNAAAFALGALVGAIQALRLEYYEMFSRLFASSGRPFTPWHVLIRRWETP